ncbi:hypothetical protein GGR52DRAFT_585355 [Hypoxylon sp. FL1284]|nr:hypothetical protein GGR52DRAFT_585355 [Hypoxylon sp. FL1284]
MFGESAAAAAALGRHTVAAVDETPSHKDSPETAAQDGSPERPSQSVPATTECLRGMPPNCRLAMGTVPTATSSTSTSTSSTANDVSSPPSELEGGDVEITQGPPTTAAKDTSPTATTGYGCGEITYRWDDAGPDGLRVWCFCLPPSSSPTRRITSRPAHQLSHTPPSTARVRSSFRQTRETPSPIKHFARRYPEVDIITKKSAPGRCAAYIYHRVGCSADPPAREYGRIEDPEGHPSRHKNRRLDGAYYRTDIPTRTAEERKAASPSARSPITIIRGDRLGDTRHRASGIHSTTMFEGPPGAPFCWHVEDRETRASSYCLLGERRWNVIPPSFADAAEKHDAVFGVGGFAGRGIPIKSFLQSAGDIIVIFPKAYHSGYAVDYSVADARNYADSG